MPFAFAVAALVTGRLGEGWLVETRRWTLFAWGFLTVGIVLGAWWSYEVLGWGGYWAWDPVENASFLPWLTGTAFIHSVMVQERRGMLRVWNLSLLLATFCLTILGTFLTRSGVLDSVHAFTQSADRAGHPGLLRPRRRRHRSALIGWRGDRLRSPGTIDSPVSREGAFLANNVLFAAFAFVVLLGTVFPLLAEAINGQQLSVGGPYFDSHDQADRAVPALPHGGRAGAALAQGVDRAAAPPAACGRRGSAALTVVACVSAGLRGLDPIAAFGLGAFAGRCGGRQLVLATRRSLREGSGIWRGLVGRANGGMIVHLGVIMIAVAFAASQAFGQRQEFRLAQGQTASLAGHRVTYLGLRTVKYPNRTSEVADVRIDGGAVYRPAISQYPFVGEGIGTPSVKTGALSDVYLSLAAAPDTPGGPAVIDVVVQPLIVWLWIGGALMAVGTILAAVPGRRRRPTAPSSAAGTPLPLRTGVGAAGSPVDGSSASPSGSPSGLPSGSPSGSPEPVPAGSSAGSPAIGPGAAAPLANVE